jgi:hypothetical protein
MSQPIAASPAVQILCRQFVERFQYEQEQLAKVAFETDKHDSASGLRFDVFNAVFVMPEIAPPAVDAPADSPVE